MGENMVDVSVIIPVYMKEKYIERCVKSIQEQVYRNFEIICVDDCSPDGCYEILSKMAEQDSRIKLIRNNENRGAAISRNIGINSAKGEYLLILDADDFYEKSLISESYAICKENNFDILLFDYSKYDDKTKQEYRNYSIPFSILRTNKCAPKIDEPIIENYAFQLSLAAPWTKMYKREFVIKNGLYFQNLTSSNDVYFGRSAMVLADNIGYLSKKMVSYRINTQYQISNDREMNVINVARACLEVKNRLKSEKRYKKSCKSFFTYTLSTIIGKLRKVDERSFVNQFAKVKELLEIIYDDIELKREEMFLNEFYIYWFSDFMNLKGNYEKFKGIPNEYEYALRYEDKKVDELKDYIVRSNAKSILWGYGVVGKQFYTAWNKYVGGIDGIVDAGKDSEGIMKPGEIIGRNVVVLTANSLIIPDIVKDMSSNNGTCAIVDVQSYFIFNMCLEDCIFNI